MEGLEIEEKGICGVCWLGTEELYPAFLFLEMITKIAKIVKLGSAWKGWNNDLDQKEWIQALVWHSGCTHA